VVGEYEVRGNREGFWRSHIVGWHASGESIRGVLSGARDFGVGVLFLETEIQAWGGGPGNSPNHLP
jgi:hypothetical protein